MTWRKKVLNGTGRVSEQQIHPWQRPLPLSAKGTHTCHQWMQLIFFSFLLSYNTEETFGSQRGLFFFSSFFTSTPLFTTVKRRLKDIRRVDLVPQLYIWWINETELAGGARQILPSALHTKRWHPFGVKESLGVFSGELVDEWSCKF